MPRLLRYYNNNNNNNTNLRLNRNNLSLSFTLSWGRKTGSSRSFGNQQQCWYPAVLNSYASRSDSFSSRSRSRSCDNLVLSAGNLTRTFENTCILHNPCHCQQRHFGGSSNSSGSSSGNDNTNTTTTTTGNNSTTKEAEKEEIVDPQDEYTQKVVIEMPDVGDIHAKGKILKWYKQEGDIVRPDDTICDIETDLFTFGMDVEDENEGIMKEILVKEGDEESLKPGTPICTIMHKPMK
jgi:biotin carboxyl carrier protein